MAKRKRLSAPNPDYLSAGPAPETKNIFAGDPAPPAPRPAPIADVARGAAAEAALGEVTETLTRARDEGRMVLSLPLSEIRIDHLVRDRLAVDEDEMAVLMGSIRARGQQMPIEVVALEGGGYGLISGWRRCEALSRLLAETGEDRFSSVQALLRRPEEASEAYLAMVEENEIRVGLSYYERARIVLKAVEQGVYATEKAALQGLFHAASRPKRSKIGSFTGIVRTLDGHLRFPHALSERQGLALARSLDEDPGLAARLRILLEADPPDSADGEAARIAAALTDPAQSADQPPLQALETPTAPRPAPANETVSEPVSAPAPAPVPVPAPLPSEPAAPRDPRGLRLGRAVWMRTEGNGDIRLTGAGLTPELRAALKAFLRENG